MGAFGDLLTIYWGGSTTVSRPKPRKITKLERKYEEDRKDFENGFFGLEERKILVGYMGEYHKRFSYNKFMYYEDWLKFTENGKYNYSEVINKLIMGI